MRIDGGVATSTRQGLVDDFQNNAGVRAAVLSIRAAGTGLTLTVRLIWLRAGAPGGFRVRGGASSMAVMSGLLLGGAHQGRWHRAHAHGVHLGFRAASGYRAVRALNAAVMSGLLGLSLPIRAAPAPSSRSQCAPDLAAQSGC